MISTELADVVACIAAFHRLEKRKRLGGPERALRSRILENFEPRRIAATGSNYAPIWLSVEAPACLTSGARSQGVVVLAMSLRELSVALADAPPVGSEVALNLQVPEGEWTVTGQVRQHDVGQRSITVSIDALTSRTWELRARVA